MRDADRLTMAVSVVGLTLALTSVSLVISTSRIVEALSSIASAIRDHARARPAVTVEPGDDRG